MKITPIIPHSPSSNCLLLYPDLQNLHSVTNADEMFFISHPVRLKRRRQLKQSQAEKNANEQSSVVISCSDNPNDGERYKKSDVQRTTVKTPGGSGNTCSWSTNIMFDLSQVNKHSILDTTGPHKFHLWNRVRFLIRLNQILIRYKPHFIVVSCLLHKR